MTGNSEIPQGYKQTEFGVLPEEWVIVTIIDIAKKMRAGGTPSRKNPGYWGGNIPFVLIEDMTSANLFIDETKETINESGLQNSSAWIVPPNALLLSMYATIGATAINTIPLATNQAILAIIPKSNFDIIFGAYSLKFHSQRLASQNVQSTQKNVNKGIVASFKIPLPPLPEQRAIATTLRTVQEAKEKTDAVIAATRALKAAMMKHLFTYGPVPPEEAEKVALKETEIGQVPEGWEIKPLLDIATLQRGKDLPKQNQIPGPYPIIGSAGIMGYHKEYICKGPGVVTGRSGTIGKLHYIEGPHWPHNTGLYVKDFHGNVPKFIFYLLNLVDFNKYSSGVSVPTLNRNFIHNAILPVPPITVQQRIINILSSIDQKLDAEQSRKQAIDTLFTSFLHDLMTAKIRVNPDRLS